MNVARCTVHGVNLQNTRAVIELSREAYAMPHSQRGLQNTKKYKDTKLGPRRIDGGGVIKDGRGAIKFKYA